MSTIVLKDRNNLDVTFTRVGNTANGVVYDSSAATLLGRRRLTLQLNENTNTNRVKFKLSVPSVCASTPGCVPSVSYTLVASGDLSIVRFSSEEDRKDLVALTASLAASTEVAALVEEGLMPA